MEKIELKVRQALEFKEKNHNIINSFIVLPKDEIDKFSWPYGIENEIMEKYLDLYSSLSDEIDYFNYLVL